MKQYADARMHTAEHILNQTMVRTFGCGRSFRAHIEKKKSKCDYRLDHDPGEEKLREVERSLSHLGVQFEQVENALVTPHLVSRYMAVKQKQML